MEVSDTKNTIEDMKRLKSEFQNCQTVLKAIGDETRQHLLLIMLECECSGSRVVDIAKKTHLSRPAVSHHMQILKDAGFVRARKEGTYIYYYLAPQDREIEKLICLFQDIKQLMQNAPNRQGED